MTRAEDNPLDIADSSDWLKTPLEKLAQVDSSLRCRICKDFYKTPMITTCGHTFCSLCIRHSYSSDQKCPACRASGQTSQLKRNAVVEEIVEAFQNARPVALDFARNISSTTTKSTSPKRKAELIAEDDHDRPYKRTRSSSRRMESGEGNSHNTISLDDDKDGDYRPHSQATRSNSASNIKQRAPDLVECPICGLFVKELDINPHIDNGCQPIAKPSPILRPQVMKPSRSLQKTSASSKPIPLPYISYNGMKETSLKKKLNELSIPSWGSKIEMQNRHTEWVAIWNANCDAKNPKSTRDLLTDLGKWEKTQGALAPKTSTMGLAIKDENFIKSSWGDDHKNDFEDLIKKARQKRPIPNSAKLHPSEPSYTSSATVMDAADSISNQLTEETRIQETSLVSKIEPLSNDQSGSEQLPISLPLNMTHTERDPIEPPFPSSQLSFHKPSDDLPSSQKYFQDVESDLGMGIQTALR